MLRNIEKFITGNLEASKIKLLQDTILFLVNSPTCFTLIY